MKHFSKLMLIVLLCSSTLFVIAQQTDTIEIQRNNIGKISFARFKPNSTRIINDGITFLKNILQAKPDDELRLVRESTDKLNINHRLYQQYYKDIKVENGEYLIHGKNGIIEIINGDFKEVNISSVIPLINEHQALLRALDFVKAKKYKWEEANMEKFIKQNTNNPNATYYPKGELVITQNFLKGGKNLRLTWKFTVSSLIPDNEQWIYVDAGTGEVIRQTSLIYDVNTPCTAETRYSGTLAITGDSFTGGFRLRENRNNVNIQTMNCQSQSNYGNAIDFTNNSTNWTTGNWATINQDRQALDAHWGAENVLDYWRIIQNRNSIDGNGIQVIGYVHYFESNSPAGWPNNAQWDGNNHVMRYGDGDGITFNPLTALDVCAHEMGHGITEFTAALNPGTQESGALNEGFSDIYGACVEYWASPIKQTWLMGEEIVANPAFTCIRNLQNPKSTTALEGQHPDTYHGQFWDNNGEPHNNSTVLSHWFFLLSQGGNGTNDIGNTFALNGIGINNAQLIAFRAESMYVTSSATYADARNATIQATRDLFGTGSCEEITATNAWYAVGVGNAYSGLSVSGDNGFCTTSNNYTIPNLPTGATVQWQANPTGIVTINSPNSTQTTLTKTSDGVITLTATINACGTQFTATKQNIDVGNSFPSGVTTATSNYVNYTGPLQSGYTFFLPAGQSGNATYNVTDSRYSLFTWTPISVPSGTSWGSSGSVLSTTVTAPSAPSYSRSITIQMNAQGPCGSYSLNFTTTAVRSGSFSFSVDPNPSADYIIVSTDKTSATNNSSDLSIYALKITDRYGIVRKSFEYKTGITSTRVSLTDLNTGLYTISAFDGQEWSSKQLIIQN